MTQQQVAGAGAGEAVPWQQVRQLFERLADESPRQRARALRDQPAALRHELVQLLAQHDAELHATDADGAAFLAVPPPLPAAAEPDRRGQRLGPWELVGRLGRGGMGEVWEARRADGAYDARAAIKVLRGGFDSAALLARFAQEQRLLARLNHPHIARLLDAGRTDEGQPYFVLEAVDGRPLDEACRGLPLAQRIALFLQLADAVAHAHRMRLIHRDLKPSNVLVTVDGEVKLLDFGIAQALDVGSTGAAEGADPARGLTPGHASPEQVRGEPATAASDVYSLGVLLYQLLVGRRPHGGPEASPQRLLHAVLQERPTRPSLAAVGSDGGVPAPQLDGDLDAIVLKALAREPAQRHASVAALAQDLRDHLAGRPVSARAPTPWYLATRFVRRHRAVIAASGLALLAIAGGLGATAWQARDAVAALALLALVAGLGVSTWQARAASRARDAAQARLAQMHTLVRDIVMRYADTVTYLPGGLKMKADLLRDTLAQLERLALAGDDPVLAGERAKALARLADMELAGLDATLDDPQAAQRDAEAALALFPAGEPAHRDDPGYYMWWARALRARWHSQRGAGDLQAALASGERLAGMLRAALARFPGEPLLRNEYASALFGLGQMHDTWQLVHTGHSERALELFAESASQYRLLLAENPAQPEVLYQLGTIAGAQQIVRYKQGRLDEAVALGREAVALREQALATDPQNVGFRHGVAGEANNLTMVLLAAGHVDEALAASARGELLMQALEAEDAGVQRWGRTRRWFALHRGRALLAAGQPAQALSRFALALEAMLDDTPATRRRRGWCWLEAARAQRALGDAAAATDAAARCVAELEPVLAAQPGDAEARAWLDAARGLA